MPVSLLLPQLCVKRKHKLITRLTADVDSYRDAAYIGGVPSTLYLENWFARVRGVSPKWMDYMDVENLMKTNSTFNTILQ
jgi:hypothetical protein